MFKNNSARLRLLVVLLVIVVVAVGFVINAGTGTLSAIGWENITLLCPLGALSTMLAARLLIPQALISLVIAAALILLLGPAFCSWICPVPLVQKLRGITRKTKGKAQASGEGCASGCGACAAKREKFDSRHLVLGGSLLSAAIFGFPVFCLVCPIGLSFATILLVIRLFSGGDITLSLLVVPILLVVEVVVFRKWCSKICPLSALMSLVAKANRTFKPQVDASKCIESSRGEKCGLCARACEALIDPRHSESGMHEMNECTRCRACVDICPGNAISIPVLAKKQKDPQIPQTKE
jgi:ferredoxin-type protein NapH